MNLLLKEFKKFSKQNWRVYLLFFISLFIVILSGRGNILEIVILFMVNFLGNLFVMAMQDSYSQKNNKLGSIFQLLGGISFFCLAIYGWIFLNQNQYLLWEIAYILSIFKVFIFYNFKKDIYFINGYSLVIINIILLYLLHNYFDNISLAVLLQSLGLSFSSIGFVLLDDKKRYFTILFGTWLLVLGSIFIVYDSFLAGRTDGIALGYFLLSASVGVYYLKILKKYL